ncbi:LOW QUALITY PROTEIN: supervillin-like [Prorops nasuta]|uniref:LOW QUALITY PROTEIN: supervillin-like n=1 Tax=Prorops nasuta TaxID=863751 RepID=UPI0034CDE7DD
MVAAGATALMAASEESSSDGIENSSAQCTTQFSASRNNEVQHSQRSKELSSKKNLSAVSSNTNLILTGDNNQAHAVEKIVKSSTRAENNKPSLIRETKASRLRAASIISPSGGASLSKRLGIPESSTVWSLQPSTSLSPKEDDSVSDNSSTMNLVRERDKNFRRKSSLSQAVNAQSLPPDRVNNPDQKERRLRRQSNKQGHISDSISSIDSGVYRQTASSLQKRHAESKQASPKAFARYTSNRSKNFTLGNSQSASGHSDSEVSRRVDALTALTKATMERVERLTSNSNVSINQEYHSEAQPSNLSSSENSTNAFSQTTNFFTPGSPSKYSILKRTNEESQDNSITRSQNPPVSILKHKDSESSQSSSNSSHQTLPVTFSPSVVEPSNSKRHGILKKRSSLDESEILRRRSCSPDVSFVDSSHSEFRPILKNQRRSSLDEIIKRGQSPDPQPTSILKRKSSREDDREDRQLGSPEPQSILKRKSSNSSRSCSVGHHVTISIDVASPSTIETVENSEVKPILKKKHNKEEFSSNDTSSLEPRPILKKKSSTESDEHDDKPKKTILKCSRKSSQEDNSCEAELGSPKKLSMLRNRVLQFRSGSVEADCVRPILKQSASRENESRMRSNINDSTLNNGATATEDLFLRKRAQSVSHEQPSNLYVEAASVLNKRRSLESTSLIDSPVAPKTTTDFSLNVETIERNEILIVSTPYKVSKSSPTSQKFVFKQHNKDKMVPMHKAAEVVSKDESYVVSINNDTKDNSLPNQIVNSDELASHSKLSVNEKEARVNDSGYGVQRSNSVSKLAMHFKSLQEKGKATEKEKSTLSGHRKGSHGVLRYRDRKEHCNERFNTQPVTLQEVQEAVLQNQRNTSNVLDDKATVNDDEFDPSKLSLAERVRMFDEKIAIKNVKSIHRASEERQQRRRPGSRYKTQPITFEEVEVASRINLQLNPIDDSPSNKGKKYNNVFYKCFQPISSFLSRVSRFDTFQAELPKSILKPSSSQVYNVPRPKSPELEGLKLIKSVLKKESEELQQQASETCDIFPRSILKPNPPLKSEENSSSCDDYGALIEKPIIMQNKYTTGKSTQHEQKESAIKVSDDIKQNLHLACVGDKNDHKDDVQNETKLRYTVPSIKNISQDQLYKSRTNDHVDSVDHTEAASKMAISKKQYKKNQYLSPDDTPRTSDDEASSSGGQEVRSIIKNESELRRRQAMLSKPTKYTALAKSASHHALNNEDSLVGSAVHKHGAVPLPGLIRSATQNIPSVEANETAGMSIAERLAALQRNGNTNWKKRVISTDFSSSTQSDTDSASGSLISKEEMIIKQGVLADCLGKLESATEGWRKRIATTDVQKFSVAGKMKIEQNSSLQSDITSPLVEVKNIIDKKKKTPRPERFKGRKGIAKDSSSMPNSPSKDLAVSLLGSFSEPNSEESDEENKSNRNLLSTISVLKTDDESFTSFFNSVSWEKCKTERLDVVESDFDFVRPHSELLVQKRNIQFQRRRATSKNPLKVLAARTDLKTEYTEIKTGVAERVMKSINIDKLAKNSSLAVEALAGLASTEDFSAVTLRNTAEVDISVGKLRPYKDMMLILVKGRRHVQMRLIEPIAENINSGDNFILVTKAEIYNYIGKFSNVIERARGAEIALSIQQNKDLGCQATQLVTINEEKITCTKSQLTKFWNHLGATSDDVEVTDGGHPDEDEIYESAMIDTNLVYEVKDNELVPLEKYWGVIPKIKMLDPNKVLVFDFGSEMYIWSGKVAPANKKKIATQLAIELWEEGYDYSECMICPINAASMIGRHNKSIEEVKRAKVRPKWCLLGKLTQHVETILFREKFLDWPNVTGIIRVKSMKNIEKADGSVTVQPCDVSDMIKPNITPVDLVVSGCHLGRGTGWYDDELMRQYTVTTTSVTVWHIDEFSHTQLSEQSVGQFYTGDSYIVRWMYSVTISGRELSGQPSKHSAKGRDRSAYFMWQGKNASLNEQGAAALLTVELDHDQGPQIRVAQGHEPAAFLNLFDGKMIVHAGKKTEKNSYQEWRLYISCGTVKSETFLLEVPCSTRQLRGRGSLILLNTKTGKLYVWYGYNVLSHIKKNTLHAANMIKENRPQEIGLNEMCNVAINIIVEGKEPIEFFDALGGMQKHLYIRLGKNEAQDHTLRLFHLSSVLKEFKAIELLCSNRADLPTPFPFLQDELYSANQPALFLLDNKNEIWIWQGWWPDTEAEDQSGSKAVRWQAEKRAAMTVAMQYWKKTHPETSKVPIHLVWAGLEPLEFINLFPTWTYRDDIAALNIEDGRNPGEILSVENELARLTQSTYPPAQLLQRPLPEGVDPTRLEIYLSSQHFKELLGMDKEEFQHLPVWKQVNLKKEIGLF